MWKRTTSVSHTHARSTPRMICGFSLLEMIISLAVLIVLTGAVFEQIIAMQRKSLAEETKVDTEQQAREFVDQMVRDLHMAGYPKASMYSTLSTGTTPPENTHWVAAGLVSASPTQIVLEGDVDNNGQVESVNVSYIPSSPGDPNCPCIRRSAVAKIDASPLQQPVQASDYTETGHIVPPGTGLGQSGADLFTFYDSSGKQLDVSSGVNISNDDPSNPILPKISTVNINVSLLTREVGAGSGETARTSLSATARLDQ